MTKSPDKIADMLVSLLKDNPEFSECWSAVQGQVILTLPSGESFRLVVERRS